MIAAAIYNTSTYKKRGGEKFTPADFFTSLVVPEPETSEEEQKLAFMRMFGWKPKEERANG